MNPEAQVELERILAIRPENLTSEEVAFLAARRAELTKAQAEEYGDVIKAYDKAHTETKPQETEPVKQHGRSKTK